MEEFKIAFDLNAFTEYFVKYEMKPYKGKIKPPKRLKKKKFYIFDLFKAKPQNLGTFLITFLNTDFSKKENFRDFVFEYLYVPFLVQINRDIYTSSEIHGDNILMMDFKNYHFQIILSDAEIEYYFEEMYRLYYPVLLEHQKKFKALADLKYFDYLYSDLDKKDKLYEEKLSDWKKLRKKETYIKSLDNLSISVLNLRLNFNLLYFYTSKTQEYILENIPYAFSSKKYTDILFITLRQLTTLRKKLKIQICENCGKYFIPKTAHDTKYCDEIFEGKRTCKEIGRELAYNKKLEKNVLCKKYRSRYQSLSKQASVETKLNKSKKLFELYKVEGSIMLDKYKKNEISAAEFEDWIDSMRIKK